MLLILSSKTISQTRVDKHLKYDTGTPGYIQAQSTSNKLQWSEDL